MWTIPSLLLFSDPAPASSARCAASTAAEEEEGRRRYDDRMRVMQESQEQDSLGLYLNDDQLWIKEDIFKYLIKTIIFSCIHNSELPGIDR